MNFKKLWISIGIGYVVFLLFWAFRLWNHFPALMDTMEYVFPEKWFNVESFQKGLLPLWNPYIACGTPHLANFQSAAFYPLFWFWNVSGLNHWFFVLALGHVLLAAAGFPGFFFRRKGFIKKKPGDFFFFPCPGPCSSRETAVLCAIGFSGSAYLTYLWGFPTHLASLAWIPWIFCASRQLLERFSIARWLTLVVFWALQILAGYPIFTFYTLVFWLVFLTVQIGRGRAWLWFLGAWGFVLMITACQWLPFVDFLGYMHREAWGSNLYNLKWSEYLTLLAPDALGVPGTENYRGDYGNFIFGNFYLGWIPLAILICGLWKAKGKLDFWQKGLLFWLFFPLGSHFLFWSFLPDSLLDKLEVSKSSFLFVFCAMTALGLYLNQVFQKRSKKSWIQKNVLVFTVLWILDLILVPFRIVHPVLDPYQNPQVQTFAKKIKQMTGDGRLVSLRAQDQPYSSSVTDYAGSFLESAERLTQNTNVVWGIASAQGHLTTVVDGYQNLTKYLQEGFPYDGRVLDAAGVNLILTPQPLSAFKYRTLEQDWGLDLVQNAGAMPMEWETGQEKVFNSRAESFGGLLNPKIFLENETALDKQADGQIAFLPLVSQREAAAADSPCVAQFSVLASHSKYFVFDQCFAPGWHAWVDGKPSPIFRADGLWMAVGLGDKGPHDVLFQYSPISFRLGLFVTLVALAGFAFFVLRIRLFSKVSAKSGRPFWDGGPG